MAIVRTTMTASMTRRRTLMRRGRVARKTFQPQRHRDYSAWPQPKRGYGKGMASTACDVLTGIHVWLQLRRAVSCGEAPGYRLSAFTREARNSAVALAMLRLLQRGLSVTIDRLFESASTTTSLASWGIE